MYSLFNASCTNLFVQDWNRQDTDIIETFWDNISLFRQAFFENIERKKENLYYFPSLSKLLGLPTLAGDNRPRPEVAA